MLVFDLVWWVFIAIEALTVQAWYPVGVYTALATGAFLAYQRAYYRP